MPPFSGRSLTFEKELHHDNHQRKAENNHSHDPGAQLPVRICKKIQKQQSQKTEPGIAGVGKKDCPMENRNPTTSVTSSTGPPNRNAVSSARRAR